jgi:hypothetical protein
VEFSRVGGDLDRLPTLAESVSGRKRTARIEEGFDCSHFLENPPGGVVLGWRSLPVARFRSA